MRNISTLHRTLLVALLALPVGASAQNTTDDQLPIALHKLVISADGAWMAVEQRPDNDDGNVRVWSTDGDKSFTIERGHSPRISRDSRWVSALQKTPLEDSKTDKPTSKPAG